jgi:hypothetical protein
MLVVSFVVLWLCISFDIRGSVAWDEKWYAMNPELENDVVGRGRGLL